MACCKAPEAEDGTGESSDQDRDARSFDRVAARDPLVFAKRDLVEDEGGGERIQGSDCFVSL
jgi:hypothetical protein